MNETGLVHYVAAGGVVVGGDRVLVLRRPGRGEVRLPKGHIEPGETPVAAALREVREESGYCELVVRSDLGSQRVEFEHQGLRVVRDERYFLLALGNDATPSEAESQFEPMWLAWADAEAALSFDAEREWVRRARRAQASVSERAGVPVALSTGSLYTYGVARVFEIASRLGYDGIEVLVDDRWDTRQADYLRSLALTHATRIASLHTPFVPHVPGWPDDELGRLRHTVSLARELGVPVVVAHLPSAFNYIRCTWNGRARRRATVRLPRLRSGAYERFLLNDLEGPQAEGIKVCVENMPATRVANVRISAYRLNTLGGLAGFRNLALDTTHLATWGLDPSAVYERLRDRVVLIHLSNHDRRSGVGHRSPVDGDLDLSGFLTRLAADRYGGWVVVEADPSPLGASDSSGCERTLRGALEYCREALTQSKSSPR